MSRSYKKNAIVKDSDKSAKKQANKKLRSKNKHKLKDVDEDNADDVILHDDLSEVENDYNVSDWKITNAEESHGKGKSKKINK